MIRVGYFRDRSLAGSSYRYKSTVMLEDEKKRLLHV